MKKLFQISLILVLTLALVFAAFTITGNRSEMAARNICPNVGWNTRSVSCSLGAAPNLEGFAYQLPRGSIINVGWNT